MGAGGSPAGSGHPGADPGIVSGRPRDVRYPRAIMYLAQLRGHPYDANGLLVDVHPVDQKVAMKLSVVRGKLGFAKDFGHGLLDIENVSPTTVENEVKLAVRAAVADELAAGDIEERAIDVETAPGGAILLRFDYFNVALATEQTVELVTGG